MADCCVFFIICTPDSLSFAVYHAITGLCNVVSHLRKSSINPSSANFNPTAIQEFFMPRPAGATPPPLLETPSSHGRHDTVGGVVKRMGWAPIKLMHASGNTCISGCSNASGNACVSRCSIHTLTTDGPKKEVQSVVDVMVCAPPGELQQAPLIMVSGRAWSPGVYWALRLLCKTLD